MKKISRRSYVVEDRCSNTLLRTLKMHSLCARLPPPCSVCHVLKRLSLLPTRPLHDPTSHGYSLVYSFPLPALASFWRDKGTKRLTRTSPHSTAPRRSSSVERARQGSNAHRETHRTAGESLLPTGVYIKLEYSWKYGVDEDWIHTFTRFWAVVRGAVNPRPITKLVRLEIRVQD